VVRKLAERDSKVICLAGDRSSTATTKRKESEGEIRSERLLTDEESNQEKKGREEEKTMRLGKNSRKKI